MATFQSTLPARGATRIKPLHRVGVEISIHAPRTGSDGASGTRNAGGSNFNPRSPHGERQNVHALGVLLAHISIHAPRTGSDTCSISGSKSGGEFQSTLPARGATFRARACSACRAISIHAPRTGSDFYRRFCGQPRGISIHAPRTGSDPPSARLLLPPSSISIHAPRTGSDEANVQDAYTKADFNPRSPHGERQNLSKGHDAMKHFNPRSPHGERRNACSNFHRPHCISIHAPRTGSDAVDWIAVGV